MADSQILGPLLYFTAPIAAAGHRSHSKVLFTTAVVVVVNAIGSLGGKWRRGASIGLPPQPFEE